MPGGNKSGGTQAISITPACESQQPFYVFDTMETKTATNTWPELAVGLFDHLTERKAEIVYELENFEIQVPSKVGSDASHATWKINGTMKIRTSSQA